MKRVSHCRICAGQRSHVVADMGEHPLANALQPTRALAKSLPRYPLELLRCDNPDCALMQLSVSVDRELLFGEQYMYATPDSPELDAHYDTIMARLEHLGVPEHSFVVEVGSNTGQFLASLPGWAKDKLGVDPSVNVGRMARDRGIATIIDFFGPAVAAHIKKQYGLADVVVMRHCLAHTDSAREMIRSARLILDGGGLLVIENAYWLRTAKNIEYGQVYHEHMSYFSLRALRRLLEMHEMRMVHVDIAEVHGGSFVVYACRTQAHRKTTSSVACAMEDDERERVATANFAVAARCMNDDLKEFVRSRSQAGLKTYLYGASAKASTITNCAGLTDADICAAFDASPLKQGKFMPGSGIEILPPLRLQHIEEPGKSVCMLTSRNYVSEILQEQREYLTAGGRFVLSTLERLCEP